MRIGYSEAELFEKMLVEEEEGRAEEDADEGSTEFTGAAINGVAISSKRMAAKGYS